MTISDTQQDILDFIQRRFNDADVIPTVREIQTACGISSTSVVDYNLDRLVDAGLLKRREGKSRAIKIAGEPTRRELKAQIEKLKAEIAVLKDGTR